MISGKRDIVEHAAIHQQAMILEHHADAAAQLRNAASARLREILTVRRCTWPRVGRSSSAISFKQCTFAGAGMAGDEGHLARASSKLSSLSASWPDG